VSDSAKTQPESGDGNLLLRAMPWAGAVLWAAGLIAGLAHWDAPGRALRLSGVLLVGVDAARRPSLTKWTFFGIMAGVELGVWAPATALKTRFLAELFLRLVRMVVAPLLFAAIVNGIAGHSAMRAVGRVAVKAILFFEVATTAGLILGVVAVDLGGPGWGVQLPAAAQTAMAGAQQEQDWQQFVLHLFPENIAAAVAQNQFLQVAVFSILFGLALGALADAKKRPLVELCHSLAEVMYRLTRMVMMLAPLAAGAAIAAAVGGTGLAALLPLVRLFATFLVAMVVMIGLVLLPILLAFRIPLRRFLHAIAEPVAIGFATASSEAAMPMTMEKMEEFGASRWITSFVVPLGYSFNLIGSSIYLAMAAIFTAQAGGIHLTLSRQIFLLAVLVLASKGVAGVPRAVPLVLFATASALSLPVAPIVLLLGIDPLLDMFRTALNVAGNGMACAVVASWEKELRVPAE
jgi:proton glutamate symport protein